MRAAALADSISYVVVSSSAVACRRQAHMGLWWAESGQAMLTGPWKGGRGAGRARRGLSVIVGLKKRVHVNFLV